MTSLPPPSDNSTKRVPRSDKPLYKKWWFWVLVMPLVGGIVGNLIPDKSARNSNNSGKNSKESPTTVQTTTTTTTILPEVMYQDILKLNIDSASESKEICNKLSKSIETQQKSTTKHLKLLKGVDGNAYRVKEFLDSVSWTIVDQEGTFTFGLETIAAEQLSGVTVSPPTRAMNMAFLIDSLATCNLAIAYSEALAQSVSVNEFVAQFRARVQNLPWYPEGFGIFSNGIAYRWLENGEYRCSYGNHCWGMYVVVQNGCPTSLYVEITILDGAGTNIGYTNDIANRVRAGDKVKLVFEDFTPGARSARVAEISCY